MKRSEYFQALVRLKRNAANYSQGRTSTVSILAVPIEPLVAQIGTS